MRRRSVVILLCLAAAAAFLGFTAPGHKILQQVGLATACSSGDGC